MEGRLGTSLEAGEMLRLEAAVWKEEVEDAESDKRTEAGSGAGRT